MSMPESKDAQSLLSQIRSIVTVNVDSMDPSAAIRHTTPVEVFCDMTSNQAIVYGQAIRPENATLIQSAIKYVKAQGVDQQSDHFDQDVVDVLTVLLARQVYPHLDVRGRVHAQTSPSIAHDTEKIIEHAKKLVSLFDTQGIPKDRVCIKIPTTPESMVACQILTNSGINTLATCVFSVPQAVAASQAGCLYVSPYFNELRVHFEPALWKEYKDTAHEHPMIPVIKSIIHVLQDSGTEVMPGSIVTAAEAIALVSLRPKHLALSASVLDQLAALPAVSADKLKPELSSTDTLGLLAEKDKEYLADAATLLKETLASESEVLRKILDALTLFDKYETKTKELIRSLI